MSPFETPLRTATLVVVAAGLLAPPGPVHSDVGDGDRALRSFERAASAPPLRAQPVDPVVWERRQRPPDRLGPTPVRPADLAMLAALRAGRWAEASRQLKAGAAVNAHDEAGSHPLALAAAAGPAGADPAAWGYNGHPPLHLAALAGHADLVEEFLRLGSPIELLNRARETALDVAASANQDGAMDLLIRGGADMTKAGRR
jgi:hypothetical protein